MRKLQPHEGETRRRYSFGGYTLDLDAGFLHCGNEEIALRPKSFQVLAYLVEHHGRLVSREELTQAVWPDVAVTDEAVTKCIADIRRAVQDNDQELIRTVARRGYILTAPVTTPVTEFVRHTSREMGHGPVPVPVGDRAEPQPADDEKIRPVPAAVEDKGKVRHLQVKWTWALAALMVTAGTPVLIVRTVATRGGRAATTANYIQVTNFTDAAFAPALSPDGRMLSFIRGENLLTIGGAGDIYVKFLPDGDPVRLTHDGRNKMTPVFTPASDRIAYGVHNLMTDPTSWSTWTVSIFGGEPQPLLSNASALTWIRDTTPPRILFSAVDAGIHMSIVTSAENRTESRTVYSPDSAGGMAHRSFLSPDRRQVLIVEMDSGGWRPCRLVPFEPGYGQEVPAGKAAGPFPGQCSSAAWSPDGEWMYFSINTGDGYHIWRQRFPDGTPEQVTFGATEEHDIVFAPDGQSFYTSVGTRQSTLWIHDARGDRQITFEGYAMLPSFSPDGKKIYYLLRSHENRRYMSGELWSSNLETGQRERLLRNFVVEHYSISPDGNRVFFVALSEKGDSRLWLGRLDGRTAPRRLSDVHASRAFFGADGEILFSGEEDGGRLLYRVKEDGSGLRKAIPEKVTYVYDVSPDGKAVAAWPDGPVQLLPTNGDPPEMISMICAAAGGQNRGTTPPCVSWSPNGKFLYLNDRSAGQIYAVPIPPGQRLPPLPAGGVKSAEEARALPGTRVIRERYAFIGSDPSTYAFFRVTSQRNIYRVRAP